MKDPDDLLRSYRPTPTRPLKSDFTQTVLKTIAAQPPKPRWIQLLQNTFVRFSVLPKFALIVLAVIGMGSAGSVAYAAYQWIAPRIAITNINPNNDDNKREYTLDVQDCGLMVGGQTADNGTERYEVAKGVNLSDEQVKKVITESCKYQRLLEFAQKLPTESPNREAKPGDTITLLEFGAGGENVINDPSYGEVTAITDKTVTIASTVYRQYNGPSVIRADEPIPDFNKLTEYFPEGKVITRTFNLAADAKVYENGEVVDKERLRVGDEVLFMARVKRTVLSEESWSKPFDVQVVQLVKSDIDLAYVRPMSVGNPAIIGAVTRLGTCQGNANYLCVASKSQHLRYTMIYLVRQLTDAPPDGRFIGNEQYFRTDITPFTMKPEHFHQIEGRITAIDGQTITLRARGKPEMFTVKLPYDAIKIFNDSHKKSIVVGDMVQLNYAQQLYENHQFVSPGDIINFALLERELPDGTMEKY